VERVLCPRASGVLSALGLAAAAPRRDAAATLMLSGASLTHERLRAEATRLLERVAAELDAAVRRARVGWELRYRGQSFELTVEQEMELELDVELFGGGRPYGRRDVVAPDAPGRGRGQAADYDPQRLCEAFAAVHEERYGYRDEQGEVELVNVRVSAFAAAPALRFGGGELVAPAQSTSTEVVCEGRPVTAALWRGEPQPGSEIEGPAVCALPEATLFVPPGWGGSVDVNGTIALERRS
jgi:N-methylhydantoinase A